MTSINLSEWAIRHKALVIYFMLMGLVAGFWSYTHLGRNEDPEFTIKTMVVQTFWPGASQDEMMRQVTDRIEKKLQETPYLDYLKSYTVTGQSTVFVNLRGEIPKEDVPDVWYQVRKKVGDITQTLPQGVVGPFFNDEFGDTYGIIYAFSADGFTHRELRDYVEKARSRILEVADVSKVEILGAQDERIYIEFSTHRLAQMGLDKMSLLKVLAEQNAVIPSGDIQTKNEKILIQVSGKFKSEEDLKHINFSVGSRMLRLSDIATIKRGYADPPQPIFRANGKDSIGLAASMRQGGDILALEKNLSQAFAQIKSDLPIGIEMHLVANQPHVVHESVDEFMKALKEAVAIVLVISFLSLGMRAGVVVATSIPLVLAFVFIAMQMLDIDLQRISLGALIIALGLLVDDAMITVESMVTKLEEGWDTAKAASFAYTSTAFPMLTGTLVTMFGFVPIGFAKSSAGEYTFSLFAVVAIALLISWFVAVIFAPVVGTMILKHKKHKKHEGDGKGMAKFRQFLLFTMRHPKATLAVTFGVFGFSLLLVPLVPQQFFPSSDRPELVVDMNLTQGSSIYATDAVGKELDAILKDDPEIVQWSSYIGRGAIRFYLPLDVQLQNDFLTETVIVTKSLEARARVHQRLDAALKEKFPEVVSRIYPLELGPPVGWPVQYRVSGYDPVKVREYAYKVAKAMGDSPDLQKVNFNWMEPIRKLRIEVNQDQARILGMSSAAVAQSIYTVISGITTTQVRDDIYLVDVIVRSQDSERMSLDTIRGLNVPLPSGKTIPLIELAAVDYEQDMPLIWRRDRLPTLTVQADVTKGVMPATAVNYLKDKVDEIRKDLPSGYAITDGGSVEESAKSQDSVAAVFPLMLILMMTVLMIQLQKFSHLFLVMSVAPLGVIGVVLGLLLTHQPMGFVALLGVVALIGMIVRNSVILVHQIEVEHEEGRNKWDAVVEATMLRFRPIMLTAAAAILGMVPIAPTVFWGPMATAIMGGLAVATVLTLIFLPSLYVTWFKIREDSEGRTNEVIL
ncbi:MAG: efflux RND transporter permease subunit [Alphaproteobacteria bacterium]|nr:efflux RND transporter permease subunit [Alphaproteobacteria bacterium]